MRKLASRRCGPPTADLLREHELNLALEPIPKWDFYELVQSPDHVLTIQTGDQALWANLLLTVGCRTVS